MNLKQLLVELQLPEKFSSTEEFAFALGTRLLDAMKKIDELGTRVNALDNARSQPRRGLFERMRLVVKGR